MNTLSVSQPQFPNQFQPFESIKHTDQNGEHWFARELMLTLEYAEWRNFTPAIEKAKITCDASGNDSSRHFVLIHDRADLGNGIQREIDNYKLTRFACYLIAQNGDPTKKKVVADAQVYFAMQTRRQELAEIPQSPGDMLVAMATAFRDLERRDAQRQRELAEEKQARLQDRAQTKAEIIELHEKQGDVVQDVEAIKAKLLNKDYHTITGHCRNQGISASIATESVKSGWGKRCTAVSQERGIEKKWTIENGREVGMYHISVLLDVVRPVEKKHGQMSLWNDDDGEK